MSKHREDSVRVVQEPRTRPSRSIRIVEPDYRLCRWCRSVWNIGRAECPPGLRSNAEIALAMSEAKQSA